MRKCFIVLVLTRFRSVCPGQQTSWFCKATFWRNKRREDSVSVVGSVFGYSSQVWSPKNVTIWAGPKEGNEVYFIFRACAVKLTGKDFPVWASYRHLSGMNTWISRSFSKRCTAWSTCHMTSFLKLCLKPERPDPPVATKSPSVRPNAKPPTMQNLPTLLLCSCNLELFTTTLRYPDINIRQFKTDLQTYYLTALRECFNKEDPRTWKTIARILKAHSHLMCGSSIWAFLECHCCFWIAGGLVSYLTMWLLTLQLLKNSIDTQEKLRLNLHSWECELLKYGRICLKCKTSRYLRFKLT
jgi:hypothetical protein